MKLAVRPSQVPLRCCTSAQRRLRPPLCAAVDRGEAGAGVRRGAAGTAHGKRKERHDAAERLMTPGVEVIAPEASISEAAEKMRHLDIGPLPVCDGERLIGMLTDRNI